MVPAPVPTISRDLAAILFGEKYTVPQAHVRAKVDPKVFDSLLGQYELRPGFILTVVRDGDKLNVEPTGQPRTELMPESETQYYVEVVDAQVTFVKDERGQVTHLVFRQGARDTTAKKIK
jgi:hypothetical protein